MTYSEALALDEWCREHKDELIAEDANGNTLASAIIDLHRMLVRKSDWPTFGLLEGAIEHYKREMGVR